MQPWVVEAMFGPRFTWSSNNVASISRAWPRIILSSIMGFPCQVNGPRLILVLDSNSGCCPRIHSVLWGYYKEFIGGLEFKKFQGSHLLGPFWSESPEVQKTIVFQFSPLFLEWGLHELRFLGCFLPEGDFWSSFFWPVHESDMFNSFLLWSSSSLTYDTDHHGYGRQPHATPGESMVVDIWLNLVHLLHFLQHYLQ